MKYYFLLILFIVSCERGWTPPENPDPKQILDEARYDFKEQRYEDALVKQVWFHENALQYSRSMGGVRLSFALNDWYRLGQVYPPALSKLKEMRDEYQSKILAGEYIRDLFQDFSAINRTLAEDSLTVKLFIIIDTKDPKFAEKVFWTAGPALIKAKKYAVYGKYLDSEQQTLFMIFQFKDDLIRAKDPKFGDRYKEFVIKRFTNDAATLISILSINNRHAEAVKIANDVKKECEDETFFAAIDSALNGIVPDPWP